MILFNYTQKAKMISMKVMKMLFTLEPLMTDLFYLYNNVKCSLLIPRILHIKVQQAAEKKKKRICLQCRRLRFNSWVWKIPWRRKWLPAPVFWPGESHGQRSLADYRVTESQTWLSNWAHSNTSFPSFKKCCNILKDPLLGVRLRGIGASQQSIPGYPYIIFSHELSFR